MRQNQITGSSLNCCLSICFLILCATSCIRSEEKKGIKKSSEDTSVTHHAERFRIVKKTGYTQITIINPWQGASNVNQTYSLVKRGDMLPDGLNSSNVIYVPVRNIICMSTTHVSMISELDEVESIVGLSGTGFIFSAPVKEYIMKGAVADVGYEANLNKELIMSISPDLIMMYGVGSESAGYIGKLRELGVNVIFNADYLEDNPLGKAEWIKVFGALYCKENIADSIFNNEVLNYHKIVKYIYEDLSYRPKVLLGLPYKETWYISPANSYISRLISDAGGEYLWNDTESSVSMPFGIENVYMRALNADYWLNTGTATSKEEINFIDTRLSELPCFKKGNLFNNIKRINESGGNDYWESGTVHPHLILKDIASILHPELFSDHELFFYQRIN